MQLPSRVLIITAALLCACSDLGDPYVYQADCNRVPGDHYFGSVPLGQFDEQTIRISNSGNINLDGDVSMASTDFSIVSGAGPFSIPPGGEISIVLRYAPSDTGLHRAAVELGDGCAPIGLAGDGMPPPEGPQCVMDPSTLAFSPVKINETAERTFEVRNVGLIDFAVDVGLLEAGPFEITSGAGFALLDPGDTLSVTVKFAPTVAGPYANALRIGTVCDTLAISATATPPFSVSYATQIQPIFDSRCTTCHGQFGNGGLDLRAGVSYGNLVNVASPVYQEIRVIPGDPDTGVLYGKITNNPEYGSRMPPTGSLLNAVQRQMFRTWIVEGANNN